MTSHRIASVRLGLLSLLFFTLSCAGPQIEHPSATGASSAVFGRESIIATAEAYADHRWMASARNAFHGVDDFGNVIDTPDENFRPQSGWSLHGGRNQGIPYQWGGASSLLKFDQGLADGKLAGHLPTRGKSFWTREAVGVDCSGLVSNCWQLPNKQSTRSLPKICLQLATYDDLLPGDILNLRDRHTMIFVAFVGPTHQRLKVIEATAKQGRVHRSVRERSDLEGRGYLPLRYRALATSSAKPASDR